MIFLDASAIVKAYVPEQGSPLVHAALARMRGRLYVTAAVALEVLSTLARHRRASTLSETEYHRARTVFLQALQGALKLLDVDLADYETGYELAHRHRHIGVGALDILHVASALHLEAQDREQPVLVASSDHALLALAQTVGLRTIDPETASLKLLLDLTRPSSA